MKLPDAIYLAVKAAFPNHGLWHALRLPQNAASRPAGLKGIEEYGSGRQFLEFHRLMIQNFKWILMHTPSSPGYVYTPWPAIPAWLKFEETLPGYLGPALATVDRLVAEGSDEELGAWIEATHFGPFPGLHNRCHRHISREELLIHGTLKLKDARLDDFSQAPHNAQFWELHGWIDEKYAAWQRVNGRPVDQSAVDPSTHSMLSASAAPHGLPPGISQERAARLIREANILLLQGSLRPNWWR